MNTSDTVGLTEFLVLVYRFFARNMGIISAFVLVGLALGIGYSQVKQKYYYSELIGYSSVIEQTNLLEILSPISTLVEEKNYQEVAKRLHISTESAAEIRMIGFSTSRHTQTSNAPLTTDDKMGELVLIQVEVYNQAILPEIEFGLKQFLAENEYISKSLELELRKTNVLIEEISKNLHVLDSINNDPRASEVNSTITIKGQLNPVNYNEALEYVESLRNSASTIEPFTVISSFYTLAKPANKIINVVVGITVAFFLLGLITVFIREIASLARKN